MDLGARRLHCPSEENDDCLHNGISVEIIIHLQSRGSGYRGTFLPPLFFILNHHAA